MMWLWQCSKRFLQGTRYMQKGYSDQLKLRRCQRGSEQEQRRKDSTYQQGRRRCCFAQTWCLQDRKHQRYMERGRGWPSRTILLGKLRCLRLIQQGKRYQQGMSCKRQCLWLRQFFRRNLLGIASTRLQWSHMCQGRMEYPLCLQDCM